MLQRRTFMLSLLATPAIVRAASLMPVSAPAAALAAPFAAVQGEALRAGWFGVPGWYDLGDALAGAQGLPPGGGRLLV